MTPIFDLAQDRSSEAPLDQDSARTALDELFTLAGGGPPRTPRERRAQDLVDRDLGVDATGVYGNARSLGGKPARSLSESKVVPNQIHQISGIFAIMNGKGSSR